ncbi:Lysophospholipase, alpha-beta hydrolase superfamily [Georgenia satyanarayanai]|uniref:Lysophospholipase, alpha-beta hydrolase superfamily n=1 Tax=Georgenia satyanarayanai TaxID=860221 RepID=A0A2Y9C2S4_9MICO|nr:alpha/beta hydrolase [Georgenia satyanarayanai]PYG01793.1 alpha-beta hydrolase superfamily lysophospholipase [Georgenia satyanarayanai]SSA36593.1 Lysophospholipase, alpha-beta hydrolase superfamily [Georgenia satyanarayanai]
MDHVTSQDGTTIAWRSVGEGPPAVVVNGALSEHSSALPLAHALAGDLRVTVYDRRSRGHSEDLSPGVDGAVERELADLAAVVEAALGTADDDDGVTVIGSSSGGLLALAAAATGLPVARVVVFEPPLATPDFPLSAPPGLPEQLHALVGEGRRGDAVALFLTSAVGLPAEVVTQMRQLPDWPEREALAASTVYDTALSRRYPEASAFGPVDVPVLALHGEATWPMLRASAVAVGESFPRGRHREVAGADHQLDPDAVAAAVREQLAAG